MLSEEQEHSKQLFQLELKDTTFLSYFEKNKKKNPRMASKYVNSGVW